MESFFVSEIETQRVSAWVPVGLTLIRGVSSSLFCAQPTMDLNVVHSTGLAKEVLP
jgi:hypothetical protein